MTDLFRMDLHTHTDHSIDGWTPPDVLVARARAAGLDRIAVTDHGTIDGALAAQAIDPDLVIVGEEIRCADDTELIGLFLSRHVPDGLGVAETARRIRLQGGVVYAPHPFAYLTRGSEHARRALAVADVAEAFNARAFWPPWNRAATELAGRRGLRLAAGSDAHFPWEIGRAYVELPVFQSAEGLLEALARGNPVAVRTSSPVVHLGSVALHALRRMRSEKRLPSRLART